MEKLNSGGKSGKKSVIGLQSSGDIMQNTLNNAEKRKENTTQNTEKNVLRRIGTVGRKGNFWKRKERWFRLNEKELRYVIPGCAVPKKNSTQIAFNRSTGRPFVTQSKRYKEYEKTAGWYLRAIPEKPINYPVNIKYLFYFPDMRTRDASNVIEALDDILQKYSIIADDKWTIVAGHDGTRCYLDRQNPRTEIYITPVDLEVW